MYWKGKQMRWMSINQWKKKYKIGLVSEEGSVLYKEFFSLKMGDRKLVFEAKKRYVRIVSDPLDSVVLISRDRAKDLMEVLAIEINMPTPGKEEGAPTKDALGFKVYGDFKDAMGVPVKVREVDATHVAIFAEGIPHLRVGEVSDLIKALSLFVGDRRAL